MLRKRNGRGAGKKEAEVVEENEVDVVEEM